MRMPILQMGSLGHTWIKRRAEGRVLMCGRLTLDLNPSWLSRAHSLLPAEPGK